MKIAEILGKGEKNALTAETLSEMTGIGRRELYRKIELERSDGAFICASDRGFFLPETAKDIEIFYERYSRRCKKQLYTVRHFKRAMQNIEGQMRF